MKFKILFFLFCAVYLTSTLAFQHRASLKSKIFIPSIVFPDILPIGRGLFFRRRHSEQKNTTDNHKNITHSKNNTNISNSKGNESLWNLDNNEKNQSINDHLNKSENAPNNISEKIRNETKVQEVQNAHHNSFKQPFHFLGSLAFIQRDALTSQLLVCLSMFALVLIVIFCVQCGLQSKEKKDKEFQRVFKMAINEN